MSSLACRLATVPTCPTSIIEHKFASSNFTNLRRCLASDPTLALLAPTPMPLPNADTFAPTPPPLQQSQLATPKSEHEVREPTWLEYVLV